MSGECLPLQTHLMSSPTPIQPPSFERQSRPLLISIIGGSEPPARALALAEEAGQELARRGAVVVCGGLGGVMEAVCKGAKSAGGTTIGILPGNSPTDANPYVDLSICTGIGYARNVIVVKTGRAVIALDGAYGTLSEIGHALGDGIPVIGLETWDLPRRDDLPIEMTMAGSVHEAVDLAIKAAERRALQEQVRLH